MDGQTLLSLAVVVLVLFLVILGLVATVSDGPRGRRAAELLRELMRWIGDLLDRIGRAVRGQPPQVGTSAA